MTDLFIRRATIDEAPAIAEVFLAARRSILHIVPMIHPDEDTRVWVRDVLFRDTAMWVAEIGGRIVGLMSLTPGWLEHLYVDPDRHGQGAGAALLLRAKNATEANDGLALWTFQANDGARRFYERYGFVAERFTDGAGNEERAPDVLYRWRPSNVTADS